MQCFTLCHNSNCWNRKCPHTVVAHEQENAKCQRGHRRKINRTRHPTFGPSGADASSIHFVRFYARDCKKSGAGGGTNTWCISWASCRSNVYLHRRFLWVPERSIERSLSPLRRAFFVSAAAFCAGLVLLLLTFPAGEGEGYEGASGAGARN